VVLRWLDWLHCKLTFDITEEKTPPVEVDWQWAERKSWLCGQKGPISCECRLFIAKFIGVARNEEMLSFQSSSTREPLLSFQESSWISKMESLQPAPTSRFEY
jgi:hypothetical protein